MPFEMKKGKTPSFIKLKGVEESIQTWVKLNGCDETPKPDNDLERRRRTESDSQDLRGRREWKRGHPDRDRARRSHMAGLGAARGIHRHIGEERVGQRPHVDFFPEAQVELKLRPGPAATTAFVIDRSAWLIWRSDCGLFENGL